MKEKDIAVFFCPPFSMYPKQPSDVSKCELIDCPTCSKPMWFSEKKKCLKKVSEELGKDIILECFICFSLRMKENPDLLKGHVRVDI